MLLRFPFLEGISCPPAALGLLGPWTGTAALETEGLLCMCMLCSNHLKYSAISPWEYSLCAPRVAWRNLRASQGRRPHWKPWRTLRAQGAKEGTISPVASKRSKAIPWAATRFGRRQKRVNHSQESWGLTYYLGSVDGCQDKESGGTPVMLSCCATLPRRWELGSVPSYYIYGTAQAIVSVFSYMCNEGACFWFLIQLWSQAKGLGERHRFLHFGCLLCMICLCWLCRDWGRHSTRTTWKEGGRDTRAHWKNESWTLGSGKLNYTPVI